MLDVKSPCHFVGASAALGVPGLIYARSTGQNYGRRIIDELRRRRLHVQHLEGPPAPSAPEVVRGLLAVQSQDLEPAAWSVAMRTRDLDEARFFALYDSGTILRTHVLRPTWHFVHPDDIRWLLSVTAPRVHVVNGFMYRSTGLDPALLQRATDVIVAALQDGPLTRNELAARLSTDGIEAAGPRLAYIVMHAELEQVVCSGPRQGKQLTYELLDRLAPPAGAAPFDRDRALGELAVRFVTGHGPATMRDLATWASLTIADARLAFEGAGERLERIEVAGRTFHVAPGMPSPPAGRSPSAHLLQPYDEYVGGFPDSRDVHGAHECGPDGRFYSDIIVDGVHIGTWRRTIHRDRVTVEVAPHEPLAGALAEAVTAAADRYGAFQDRPVELVEIGR